MRLFDILDHIIDYLSFEQLLNFIQIKKILSYKYYKNKICNNIINLFHSINYYDNMKDIHETINQILKNGEVNKIRLLIHLFDNNTNYHIRLFDIMTNNIIYIQHESIENIYIDYVKKCNNHMNQSMYHYIII